MKPHRLSRTVIHSAAALVLCTGSPLAAQGYLYRVTDLGAVPSYPWSRAVDINERGEVLVSADWPPRTYVYDPDTGQLVDIGQPAGEIRFEGIKINERGQVIGQGIGGDGLYLYTPGQGFVDLGRLDPSQPAAGSACGLNDLGEVVGGAKDIVPGLAPFFWTASAGMQHVSFGQTGYLCDLNNQGEAIGRIANQWVYWVRSSGSTGLSVPLSFEPEYLQDDGTIASYVGSTGQILLRDRFGQITTLPGVTVQHNGGYVAGRNSEGVIAGGWSYFYYSGSTQIWRHGAFLHVPGRGATNLEVTNNGIVDPAWDVAVLSAMNELGQIVGLGGPTGTTVRHALRLDPVSPAAAANPVGQGCSLSGGRTPTLSSGLPVIARDLDFQLTGSAASTPGALVVGFPAGTPTTLGNCLVHLDRQAPMVTFPLTTDGQGAWSGSIDLPPNRILLGLDLAAQAAVLPPAPALQLTNGVILTVGF